MRSLFFWRSIALSAAAALTCSYAAGGENWPQWRGPQQDGTSRETDLPTTWGPEDNVAWRVNLPGPAGSTPIVWDDQVFLTSVDGDQIVLLSIGTDGQLRWKEALGSGGEAQYRSDEGNNASPSPCTDGEHVWACTSNGHLACFTVSGQPVWTVDLQQRYGAYEIQFGLSSTPVLDRGRLYLQLIHGAMNQEPADNALVICLDAQSGKEIWKQRRITDAVMENKHSYASPVLYRDDTQEFLLTHGGDYVIAHRLEDGSEIWRCGGLNPRDARYNPFLRFVASPAVAPGYIVVPSAKRGPVLCLKPEGQGDRTEDEKGYRWKLSEGTPDVPSPLIHDGLVYLCSENGNLTCLDAKTGEAYYSQERTERGRHRASPVYADGKIYLVARNEGIVTVVKAGKQFQVLAQNRMGEPIAASPAIANGRIYLRTFDALYAIGK